jgi:succinyl-diaminopimelate desuccinylase
VRLIVGTNEETGWGCMKYYLGHCEIPSASFSPDGMFTVVNREKGILSFTFSKAGPQDGWQGVSVRGGEAANLVPARAEAVMACRGNVADDLEKAVREYKAAEVLAFSTRRTDDNRVEISCRGKSAHAMSPEKGTNAVLGLLNLLCSLDCFDPSVRNESGSIVRLMGTAPDGSAIGVACGDDVSGALTMNLGKLDIVNGRITIQLDVRTPVTAPAGGIAERICAAFSAAGYTVDRRSVKQPLYVPADMPLVKTLCDVYQSVTGNEPVLYSIGGGTYARAFPNCVCFGSVYPGEELTVHSPNERTLLTNLIQNAKMYGLAIRELAS